MEVQHATSNTTFHMQMVNSMQMGASMRRRWMRRHVHDVVDALAQVVVEVLVTGGGHAEERRAGG